MTLCKEGRTHGLPVLEGIYPVVDVDGLRIHTGIGLSPSSAVCCLAVPSPPFQRSNSAQRDAGQNRSASDLLGMAPCP